MYQNGHSLTAKYEILQLYPNGHSFSIGKYEILQFYANCPSSFYSEIQNFENCRPWNQTKLVLNSIEKEKPGSLFSLMCMFPESNGKKIWSHSFYLQNSGILQTRMGQRVGPHENKFWHFSKTKMNITNS